MNQDLMTLSDALIKAQKDDLQIRPWLDDEPDGWGMIVENHQCGSVFRCDDEEYQITKQMMYNEIWEVENISKVIKND